MALHNITGAETVADAAAGLSSGKDGASPFSPSPRFRSHGDEINWLYWRSDTETARRHVGNARAHARELRAEIEHGHVFHRATLIVLLQLLANEMALADDALALALGEAVR